MNSRFKLLRVLSPAVLSIVVIACGDDGSGGDTVADGGLDASPETTGFFGFDGSVANEDASSDTTNPDSDSDDNGTGINVTLTQSDDSTNDLPDATDDNGGADAAEAGDDTSTADEPDATNAETSEPIDPGVDASTDSTLTSEPVDASDTTTTATDVPDAADDTITSDTDPSSTDQPDAASDTSEPETSAPTDDQDASVDGGDVTTGPETTDIPTSNVTTGESEAHWEQLTWSGSVFPFGATGVVTQENGTVCVSGNETGTVGLLYNVMQVEDQEPMLYAPGNNDVGIDLNIVSEIGGQVRFTAGDTEYCAQAVEGETFYFWFWSRFHDCETGLLDYDGQTPFESIAIVLSASGDYELCVDKFDVGVLPDGGVLVFDAAVPQDAAMQQGDAF